MIPASPSLTTLIPSDSCQPIRHPQPLRALLFLRDLYVFSVLYRTTFVFHRCASISSSLSAVDRCNSNTHTLMPLAPLTSTTAVLTTLSSRPVELDRASQNAPNHNAPKRRLVDFTPPDAVSAPPLNVGTAPISPSSRTVLTIPLNVSSGPKCCLYLTRIASSVSDADFKSTTSSL